MSEIIIFGSRDFGTKNDPTAIAQSIGGKVFWWEDLLFDIQPSTATIEANGQPICTNQTKLALAFGWYRSGDKSAMRDIALATGLFVKNQDVPIWNSEIAEQRSTTKLSCMQLLANQKIPVPRTLFSLNPKILYHASLNKMHFPLVVKSAAASRGRGNHLVQTADELRALLLEQSTNRYLVQPFMPNDHDLRIICFGGEPELILKRSRATGNGGHLNNSSQGGKAEWLTKESINAEILEQCRQICGLMHREMAGIDLIPDQNSATGYACLEVNSIPQLTSGFDVDLKLQKLALLTKKFKD